MTTKSRSQKRRQRRLQAVAESRATTCPSGKAGYRDAAAAEVVLARIASQSTRHTVPVRTYECPLCWRWHLTSREMPATGPLCGPVGPAGPGVALGAWQPTSGPQRPAEPIECCPGADVWFDWSICPEPCDTMHYRCTECGKAVDRCDHDEPAVRATFRDAATGQYVTAEHAATNPATTVREVVVTEALAALANCGLSLPVAHALARTSPEDAHRIAASIAAELHQRGDRP